MFKGLIRRFIPRRLMKNVQIGKKVNIEDTQPNHRGAQVWNALSRDYTDLLATSEFIHERNEPCLPLSFQPKLVNIILPTQEGWKAELA